MDDVPRFSHSGARFVLGYGSDFFGIWDRRAPQLPVERFPRTDQGWREAWLRFRDLESDWVEVRPGSENVGVGPASLPSLAPPVARLGARIVDGLIIAAVLTAVVAAGAIDLESSSLETFPTQLIAVTLVASLVYETAFIAVRGQTPGKMVLGIRVVRTVDQAVPGWGPAFIRWAIPVAASIVPFGALVVYLWLLWDRRRQGLHDKAAGTIVVPAAGRWGV